MFDHRLDSTRSIKTIGIVAGIPIKAIPKTIFIFQDDGQTLNQQVRELIHGPQKMQKNPRNLQNY